MTSLVLPILNGSSSYLQIRRTTIKAWMKCCDHSSAFIFYLIFSILAGNKDNHKISDGFEIRPDQTLDRGISYP